MNLTLRSTAALWGAGAILVAVLGFYIGGSLRPGEDPVYLFETDAPAFVTPTDIAATSPGGFTGFGETDGSNARVAIAGRIVEITDGGLVLEGAQGQRTSVSFSGEPPVLRLEGSDVDQLREGLNVALRLDDEGTTVESVLVLSER